MRKWSSSLIITENVWSLLMMTPASALAPLSSRLMRWRSTRICRSSSLSSLVSTSRPCCIGSVATTARRQPAKISARCTGLAQPGNGRLARLRARRMRVISTIAVLLPAAPVSSEGGSLREAIGLAFPRRLLSGGLLDLVDFIAGAGGVFVAFGFHGLREVEFELAEPVGEGFALECTVRDFAGVFRAFVQVVEHRLDDGLERLVARGAAEAA